MSDVGFAPGDSDRPPELSDEELRSWYADLIVPDDEEHVEPHVPLSVEPDIELLREAYEEYRVAVVAVVEEEEAERWVQAAAEAAQRVVQAAAEAAQRVEQAAAEAAKLAEALAQTNPSAEAEAVAQVARLAERLADVQMARLSEAAEEHPRVDHSVGQSLRHRAAHRCGMRHRR